MNINIIILSPHPCQLYRHHHFIHFFFFLKQTNLLSRSIYPWPLFVLVIKSLYPPLSPTLSLSHSFSPPLSLSLFRLFYLPVDSIFPISVHRNNYEKQNQKPNTSNHQPPCGPLPFFLPLPLLSHSDMRPGSDCQG